jgi:hypothetical protein
MWDPSDELNRGRRAIRRCARRWSRFLWCGVLVGASACGDEDSGGQTTPEAAAENERPGGSGQTATTDGDAPGMAEGMTSNMPVSVLEGFFTQYHDWHPRTATPVNVSSEIFTLCRSPTLSEDAFVESEHGDGRMLMDWLNSIARAGFEALGDEGFAPGAAIVKEKLIYREGSPEPELVAIGIMLKHEPGFDSELGDWEFAYWEEEPGLIDGPEQSTYCGGCHASSPTDFVFLDDSWRDSAEGL